MIRILRIAALCATGILTLVLILHAPVVRAAALRYVLAAIERDYGLTVVAERLDYNLASLRLGLAGVRVWASGSREPFFLADYVSVTVPWAAVAGAVAFDDITLSNARIAVRQYADGTSNLPKAADSPGSDPPALRVHRLAAPDLAISLVDQPRDLSIDVPALALLLTPDAGTIALDAPAILRAGGRSIRVSELRGGAAFDGRALHLDTTRVVTEEADVTLDGVFVLIAREPTLDLRISGEADLAALVRLADADVDAAATLVVRGMVRGDLAAPTADVEIASDRVAWQGVTVTDASVRGRVSADAITVDTSRFAFGGGEIAADAYLPLDGGPGRVYAAWNDVRVDAAVALAAADAQIVPSAVTSGDLSIAGTLTDWSTYYGTARIELEPGANARGRMAVGGWVVGSFMDGTWELTSQAMIARAVPTRIRLRGGGSPAAATGTVRIDSADVPAVVAALRTIGILPEGGDIVSAGSLEADIDLTGALASPSIVARAQLTELAGANLAIDRLDLRAEGEPVARRLAIAIEAPSAVVADERLDDVNVSGQLSGSLLTIDTLTARQADRPGRLAARGIYDLDARRGAADLTLADLFAGDVALGIIETRVELDGAAADVEARAASFDTRAHGSVRLEAPYEAVVTVDADRLELSRLLGGVDLPTPLVGEAGISARFEGPLADWRRGTAVVEVERFDVTAGDLPLRLAAAARVRYDGARAIVDVLELDAGGTRVSVLGALDAFEPSRAAAGLLITLTGDVGEVARAAAAARLTQLPFAGGTGPVALLARITGSLESPVVAADLEVGPASIELADLPPVSDLQLRAYAGGGWLELRQGSASYQGADVSVTGRAPLSWVAPALASASGQAELRARAANITPAVVAPFIDPGAVDQLQGVVDATLDLVSVAPDVASISGELRLDRLDLRIADLPVTQRIPTRIVARDGFARVAAWDWIGQGATLAIDGQVRLDDRQAAILANGVVDLRLLTPFVRGAGLTTLGTVQPRLSITGSLAEPRVDGDITLTEGEVRLVDPRIIASGLTARAVVSRTSARITSLAGAVNGGDLSGSGVVEYSAASGVDLQLAAAIRGMTLEFPAGLRSEIDAALDLALDLTPQPAGRLSGTVTVLRGSYREPMAVITGLLAGARQTGRAAAPGSDTSLLQALALDVRLLTEDDVVVNNNYGRFQLGADLRIVGTAAAPGLSGRAELREGGQLFVGRNVYAVTSGTIDFVDPTTIEPLLNVQATTRAGGEEIEVAIRGTAENPSYDLSSPTAPELGQADLVALLLTGRRFDDLAPGDAAFVGAQVLGNFSGEVLGFASRAVGLDTIRLGGPDLASVRSDPTAVAAELDPTSRLTFGKSLGSNVELTFSQSLRDGDAQTWIVEYLPARGLELRLVSNDENLRSYGFRHDVAFGGPPRPPRRAAGGATTDRVAAVNVAGELALAEREVRAALRLGPGDRFDFVRWQDDRDRLEALYVRHGYLTARVSATRTDTPDGVALDYQVAAGPRTRIVAAGIDLDARLRARVESAWAQATFDDFLVEEVADIVRATLAADRYLQASIDVRVLDEGDLRTLAITVDRGRLTARTIVRIQGTDDTTAAAIVEGLERRGLVATAAADPRAVEAEVDEYLRTQGHLRGRVTVGAPLFEQDVAVVPVTVDTGPAFVIGRLSIDAVAGVADATLTDIAALTPGAPYDPEVVDAARTRLVAFLRAEAFPAAAATVNAEVREDAAAVDVHVLVSEGARHVRGDLIVAGLRAVGDQVVRDAFDMTPGAPLRTDDLLRARTRVLDLGLFRRVDVAADAEAADVNDRRDDPDADGLVVPVPLRITVEEWPALRLRYGFEVAEERPETSLEGRELVPGLTADVTRRSLFGRAVTLGAVASFQRREQLGRAFVNMPTLFGWPIGSALIAERSRQDFTAATLVTERSSLTWEQRARVAGALTLSYAYTFERNHTFDTQPPTPGIPAFDITVNIARLTAAAAWDTRDDPVDTTRGSLLSLSLENAPEGAGSDIRFIRELAQAYHFRPWGSVVFATAARLGSVAPLGGQDLLASERFFAGGARTVRGVPDAGLGPRDVFGDPAGGRLLIVLNQELRVPIYRWLRGVGFVDAGNVWGRAADARLSGLVGAVGGGLRVATPFALLRVDVAKTIWNDPAGGSPRWTFGIGHTF